MGKVKSKEIKRVVLIDDPLSTVDIGFLEEILGVCNGNKYLNAVQQGSMGGTPLFFKVYKIPK